MHKHAGFIYVMSNMALKDNIYKVGISQNPKRRVEELSNPTGVPMPFEIVFSMYADFVAQVEESVHEELDEYRFNKSREFFSCDLTLIIDTIMEFAGHTEEFLVCRPWEATVHSDCDWYQDYRESDIDGLDLHNGITELTFEEVMLGVQRYRDRMAAYKKNKNVVQIK